jgi:hypothetical protein
MLCAGGRHGAIRLPVIIQNIVELAPVVRGRGQSVRGDVVRGDGIKPARRESFGI